MPEIYEHFEWLAGRMAKLDREAGAQLSFDTDYLARQLHTFIDNNRDAIHLAQELRAVIVRPMSTASVTPHLSAE